MKSNQVTTVCNSLGHGVLSERSFFARRKIGSQPKIVGARLTSDRRWKNARLNQIRERRKGLKLWCQCQPCVHKIRLAALGAWHSSDHPCRIDATAVHATLLLNATVSERERPRNGCWHCNNGCARCISGTCGRSRTSLRVDCRSSLHTPHSERLGTSLVAWSLMFRGIEDIARYHLLILLPIRIRRCSERSK